MVVSPCLVPASIAERGAGASAWGSPRALLACAQRRSGAEMSDIDAFLAARDLLLAAPHRHRRRPRRVPLADADAFQFRARPFRPHGRRQRAGRGLRFIGPGDHETRLSASPPSPNALGPGRQPPARAWACGGATACCCCWATSAGAVGGDAGLLQAGRRGHPGHHHADGGRPARPLRPRPHPPRHRRRRSRRALRAMLGDGFTRIAVGGAPGWHRFEDGVRCRTGLRAGRADPRDRPAAALLHLRHHGEAQAGAALAPELPGRPPVHDVLDRAAARRRAPQHLVAGLGQARLEQLLRALDRGGHHRHPEPAAVRRPRRAGRAGPRAGDHLLRPADRVADADPGGPDRPHSRAPARGAGRRRAAEPRGDRPGAPRLGPDHPRRLRPDGDDAAGRQHAGPGGAGRVHGLAAAGLRGRRCWTRTGPRPRRARSRCRWSRARWA